MADKKRVYTEEEYKNRDRLNGDSSTSRISQADESRTGSVDYRPEGSRGELYGNTEITHQGIEYTGQDGEIYTRNNSYDGDTAWSLQNPASASYIQNEVKNENVPYQQDSRIKFDNTRQTYNNSPAAPQRENTVLEEGHADYQPVYTDTGFNTSQENGHRHVQTQKAASPENRHIVFDQNESQAAPSQGDYRTSEGPSGTNADSRLILEERSKPGRQEAGLSSGAHISESHGETYISRRGSEENAYKTSRLKTGSNGEEQPKISNKEDSLSTARTGTEDKAASKRITIEGSSKPKVPSSGTETGTGTADILPETDRPSGSDGEKRLPEKSPAGSGKGNLFGKDQRTSENDSGELILSRGRRNARGTNGRRITDNLEEGLYPSVETGSGKLKDRKIITDEDAAKSKKRVRSGKALKAGARITTGLRMVNDRLRMQGRETDEDRDKNSFGLLKDAAGAAGKEAAGKVSGKIGEAVGSVVKAAPLASTLVIVIIIAIFIICCGLYAAWVPQTSYTYPDKNNREGETIAQVAVDRITNRLYAYEYNAMYGDAGPYEGADGTERMASLSSLGKGVNVGDVQEIKFTDGKRSETIKLNNEDSYKGTITKFVQLCMSMATVEKLNNMIGLYDDLEKKDDIQNFYDYAQHVVTLCLDCSTVKDGTWYINVDIGDVIDDEVALTHPGWKISFIRLWARSYMTMDDDTWLEMMGVEIPERIEYQLYDDGGAGSLSGDLAVIANFLKSNFGFSNAQTAAIMGNMWQESRFNVAASNRGQYLGLCQWGGGRKTALLSYAGSHNGGNWKDVNTQLGYLKQELNGSYKHCVTGLKKHDEVNSATKYWLDIFEGAPGQQLAARQAEARKILSQLESGSLDSGGGSMNSSDYIEVAVAIAANNKYIYQWGGGHITYTGRNNMPSAFDCSGFVSWCLYKSGYDLKSAFTTGSSEVSALKRLGFHEVPISQAKRGDVLMSSGHTEFCYDSTHEIGAHGIHGQYASTTPAGSAGANYSKSVSGHANSISIKSYNFKANYSGFRCFRPSGYKKGASAGSSEGGEVQQVVLNQSEAELSPSAPSITLRATVVPAKAENRKITWKSSNTKVADVKDGKVTIVGFSGTCTITASTKNGKKATCKVTIKQGISSLTCTSGLTLSVGDSSRVLVYAMPEDSYTFTWSTSNRNVARVGSDGKVYAVGKGTADITVSCAGKKAVCTVTVN